MPEPKTTYNKLAKPASKPAPRAQMQPAAHNGPIASAPKIAAEWLKAQPKIKDMPGGEIAVERLVTTINQISLGNDNTSKKLKDCTPESIFAALKECLLRGLHLGGPSGMSHAILTPYNNVCKLDITYQGMLHEARQSQSYKHIFAKCVYEGDTFRVWADDTGEHFEHIDNLDNPRNDDTMVYVYAVAFEKSGDHRFEYMTKDEIDYLEEKTRKRDKQNTWKDWYREMAKKTVLKRLAKGLERVPNLHGLIDLDNEQFVDAEPPKATLIDNSSQVHLPSNKRIESLIDAE